MRRFFEFGSTRAVVELTGDEITVVGEGSYYPFGLRWDGGSMSASGTRYTFSGKEDQFVFGLPYLDFGFRMYDHMIARWTTPDPLAEKYYSFSPYNYCVGNPVRLIDPDGRIIRVYGFDYGTNQYIPYDWQNFGNGWGFYAYNMANGSYGGVYSGNDLFISQLSLGLKSIMAGGKDGYELVEYLATHKNIVRVEKASPGQTSHTVPSGNTIFWNPDGNFVATTAGMQKNPVASLAHELGHVRDIWDGSYDDSTWFYAMGEKGTSLRVPKAEISAIHTENKIRSENGWPLRTHYSVFGIRDLMIEGSGPRVINQLGTSLYHNIDGSLIDSSTGIYNPYNYYFNSWWWMNFINNL